MGYKHRHGFTLIDVLATAGMVGVLAAMIVPAMSRSRSTALADREKAAARLMHKAWHDYAVDNREKVLPAGGHWDWVHPIVPVTPNTPLLHPADPFMPTRQLEGTIAKFWTPFLMSQVPMRTDQVQVDPATRTAFDARSPLPSSVSQGFAQYSNTSKAAAYFIHPSVGMNGVYVGGSYSHGAFRASPTTGTPTTGSGGRFYVSKLSEVRTPDSLIVFASSRGADITIDSNFFSYGANDPDTGVMRPGYWIVTPPKPHPRGRASAGSAYTLGGGWNVSNTFNPLQPPSRWGMIDLRSNGAAMTAMIDGHTEAQTLVQLRDMRKWSNYATSADWTFTPTP